MEEAETACVCVCVCKCFTTAVVFYREYMNAVPLYRVAASDGRDEKRMEEESEEASSFVRRLAVDAFLPSRSVDGEWAND
jgi:hypothetical protein